ncbi:hypothetical protein D3C87_1587670 [compost metagenome]
MGDGLGDIGEMRQVAIADLCQPCGAAGDVARLGDDGKGRLAVELDDAIGKHRLVMQVARADVVGMRHVTGGQHADHAGRGDDGRQVHGGDFGMGAIGHAQRAVQGAGRFRHVVDIVGGAGHVLVGAVVALARMHLAVDRLAFLEGRFIHLAQSFRRTCPSSGLPATFSPLLRGEGTLRRRLHSLSPLAGRGLG